MECLALVRSALYRAERRHAARNAASPVERCAHDDSLVIFTVATPLSSRLHYRSGQERKFKAMPTLATTVDGLKLPNPFIIGSGPPGTNLNVITKAFQEGWGAVIAKTVSLDSTKVINVTPRYAKLLATFCADRIESHLLAFEVALRRGT